MIPIKLMFGGIAYINLAQISNIDYKKPIMQYYFPPDIKYNSKGELIQYKVELVECDSEYEIHMSSGQMYRVTEEQGQRILELLEKHNDTCSDRT